MSSRTEEIKDAERVLPDYLRKAFKNIYAEKYQAAEKLLELANLLDKQPDRNDMSLPKPGEQMPPMTTGYLYLASAMFFFVALEALINTLYKLLLRTDFSDKNYERLTTRDLDLRIIGIHLFCQGFKTQPITPISDLWSKILQLRDFRNDIFHGNITDEDIHYAIPVDMFLFYYSPSHEFRGRKKEPNPASDIPRCMSRIDYDAVLWIKGVVDDTVSALLSAMETETQRWFSRWLSESHVMPLLPDKEKTA